MVDCVSVEKESGRGFFLPRGILTFAFRIIYCYTCRACLDEITCVAEHYLTLRIGCERHGSKNPLPFPFSTLTQSTICTQATPQGKRVFKEGRNRRCLPFLSPAVDTANVPAAAAAESSPGNGEPPSQFGHTGKPVPATSAARIGRTVCAIGRSLSILNFDTPPFLCYTKGKKTILE